jgi:hypothetical protein
MAKAAELLKAGGMTLDAISASNMRHVVEGVGNAAMSRTAASCPQLKAADVARDYGFTARYWIKLAASGRVPGAWQPSGPGGAWLFDERQFLAWREESKRKAMSCQESIAGAKSIGRAPSVRVESTAKPQDSKSSNC